MMKTFTLLSGGIDSTTALAKAMDEHGQDNAYAISIGYGQRHSKEVEAAKAICRHYEIPNVLLSLGPQPRSTLTDNERLVPRQSYADLKPGISPTYHPFRNGQMLSLATAWAISKLEELNNGDDGMLYFGAHAEDAVGWAYADCTPEFVGSMSNAIYVGTYHRVRLATPWLYMKKWQIIQEGERLEVPYALTWSCYVGGEKHCRTCPTCRAREDAFEEAGVDDPTEYETIKVDVALKTD